MKFVIYLLVIFCAYESIEMRKDIPLRSLYVFSLDYNTIEIIITTSSDY